MRVLYDTNSLVRILAKRSEIITFKEQIVQHRIVHITSKHILTETERVLSAKFNLTKQKARVATKLIAKFSEVVEPHIIECVSRDPYDDPILAAALKGNANCLVTADQDLLVLKHYKSIKIIHPKDFTKVAEHTDR